MLRLQPRPVQPKQRGHPYSKKPSKPINVPQDARVEQNSAFLGLPAEVRVRIYEELVGLKEAKKGEHEALLLEDQPSSYLVYQVCERRLFL